MKTWDYKLRLKLVKAYISKGQYLEVEGVNRHDVAERVRYWVAIYKTHGPKGLRHGIPYTDLDKVKAVKKWLNGESAYQIAMGMGLSSSTDVRRWIRVYKKEGFYGLLNKHNENRKKKMAQIVGDDELNYYANNKEALKALILNRHMEQEENAFLKKLLTLMKLK